MKQWQTLELWHDAQIEQMRALSVPQYPGVKFFAKGRAQITDPAWQDRITVVGGRAIFYDLKSTNETQGFNAPAKRRHQFELMRSADELGTPAGYLVYWEKHDQAEFYFVRHSDRWPFRMRYGEGDVIETAYRWLEIMIPKILQQFDKMQKI